MPGRLEQNVILLANVDVSLNPYITLFIQALRGQGLKAELSDKLSSIWRLSAPETTSLHLQYAETLYCVRSPSSWKSKLIRKLMCNRVVSPVRSICRLGFSLLVLTVCKLRGAWIIYTVLNLEPHTDNAPDRLLHRIASWSIVKLANRVHVCSEDAGAVVKARFKRDEGIVVVPMGNFIDHYPRGICRSDARERLRIAPEVLVFLFFGLVRPYKGIEDLVPAFCELDAGLSQKLLVIVGAVENKAYEAQIMALVGSHPDIKLLPGYVPDGELQVYLAASDLVVVPYRAATTSAGAVLALSYGRPVIAPSSPAFSSLVTEQTGILYDPRVPGALTAALRAGAERNWDENRILEFAHRFDWQQIGSSLRALYERGPQQSAFGV